MPCRLARSSVGCVLVSTGGFLADDVGQRLTDTASQAMARLVTSLSLDAHAQAIYTAPPNLTAVLVFLAGYIESSSYDGKSLGKFEAVLVAVRFVAAKSLLQFCGPCNSRP